MFLEGHHIGKFLYRDSGNAAIMDAGFGKVVQRTSILPRRPTVVYGECLQDALALVIATVIYNLNGKEGNQAGLLLHYRRITTSGVADASDSLENYSN